MYLKVMFAIANKDRERKIEVKNVCKSCNIFENLLEVSIYYYKIGVLFFSIL